MVFGWWGREGVTWGGDMVGGGRNRDQEGIGMGKEWKGRGVVGKEMLSIGSGVREVRVGRGWVGRE